ncbi:MBL fold metallo-hydrolase [Terrimonas ferruginea]|uniref:MBL fold metallo-hydrolase n=1 Tax=Terrimonas ferruginea TaxID=249 RepID=UPI000428CF19|nr:MBL fold metallo-hydrolase [Terrimonas ferruginea]
MSLFIASLNSGSNANCYYVGTAESAVLIDAGLSCRETEKRMTRLGLSMDKVQALFISHEHSDHVTGLPGLSRKYRWPVYITQPTLSSARVPLETELVRSFVSGQSIDFGHLRVLPFSKHHDAADPYSFVITAGEVNVGVFTDIGHCCEQVITHFKQCNAVFLESNYCEDMLEKGKYPWFLKQRIRGGQGHLSNAQALDLFCRHGEGVSHLILSHLSRNNNDPQLVERLFKEKAGTTNIYVASRYQESELWHITPSFTKTRSLLTAEKMRKTKIPAAQQGSLF